MQRALLFKKFLMPCGLCAAVPVLKPDAAKDEAKPCCEKSETAKLIRPSGLPIYTVDDSSPKQPSCAHKSTSVLEQEIRKIRESTQEFFGKFDDVRERVTSVYNTGLEHSAFIIDYFYEEENVIPRIGVIAAGGLTGAILGLRGSLFKRLMYTSIGGTTAAFLAYPRVMKENFEAAKHYGEIGYHFVMGTTTEEAKQTKDSVPFKFISMSEVTNHIKDFTQKFVPRLTEFKQEGSQSPSEPTTKKD